MIFKTGKKWSMIQTEADKIIDFKNISDENMLKLLINYHCY